MHLDSPGKNVTQETICRNVQILEVQKTSFKFVCKCTLAKTDLLSTAFYTVENHQKVYIFDLEIANKKLNLFVLLGYAFTNSIYVYENSLAVMYSGID